MELYQLENFIAVVEEHSFTRAAERVFRTQAAVSVIPASTSSKTVARPGA